MSRSAGENCPRKQWFALQPQQSGYMLLAKKPRSVCSSEQAASLFLCNTQQIIGNLQMINILYLLFITLPVVSSGALSFTATLSFPG